MIENNTNLQTIIKMHTFDGNLCIIYFQHFTTILYQQWVSLQEPIVFGRIEHIKLRPLYAYY